MTPVTTPTPAGSADSTLLVSLMDIFPNPWNPHKMTEGEMQDLITSIREDGQWRPILLVEMDQGDEYGMNPLAQYRIVDGEHLWRALVALHLEGAAGHKSGLAKVMVLGKNSELDNVRQMDIGQTINHGLRGSQEDPAKTQVVLDMLLKRRSAEQVARRMNIGVAGVKHLSQPAAAGKRLSGPTPGLGGLGSSVTSTSYAERKGTTVALVFESDNEVRSFEAQVETFAHLLDDSVDYKGKRGVRRIAILRAVMDRAAQAGEA